MTRAAKTLHVTHPTLSKQLKSLEDELIGLPLFCSAQGWEKLFLVWKKYQTLSPIAERFLRQIKESFDS